LEWALIVILCLMNTACMTQEVQSPPTPSPSPSAHYLNDVEVEHNLIRFNSRQDLANHVDVLIDAHPDLVFNYQRMALSEDKAVARIANYRLAQVHLELGCALYALQAKMLEPSFGVTIQRYIKHAFQLVLHLHTAKEDNPFEQTLAPWLDLVKHQSRESDRFDFHGSCFNLPSKKASPFGYLDIGGSPLEWRLDSGKVCEHLEGQYLGPLNPFIY
jgi:hypothetical protein